MRVEIDNPQEIRILALASYWILDVWSQDGGKVQIRLSNEQIQELVEDIKKREMLQELLKEFA